MTTFSPPLQVTDSVVPGRGGDIAIRDYTMNRERSAKHPLLWIHGGGFAGGGLDQRESDAVARAIAVTGRQVRTVDYRLVPRFTFRKNAPLKPSDNRFPAAADDINDVLVDLQNSTQQQVTIGGASAGACLAAATLLRVRDAAAPLPLAAVLAYGIFHAALPPPTEELRARIRAPLGFIQFTPTWVHNMNLNYVGTVTNLANPYAFPGGGPLAGLPPILLVDADRDTLRASGELFAQELVAAGVTTRHAVIARTRHAFLNQPRSQGFRHGMGLINGWLDAQDLRT